MHSVFDWLKNLEPISLGILVSMIISVSRMMYDDETSIKHGIAEVILCTSFTFVGGYSLLLFGLDPKWCIAIGGTIGGLGNLTIRTFLKKYLAKKAA